MTSLDIFKEALKCGYTVSNCVQFDDIMNIPLYRFELTPMVDSRKGVDIRAIYIKRADFISITDKKISNDSIRNAYRKSKILKDTDYILYDRFSYYSLELLTELVQLTESDFKSFDIEGFLNNCITLYNSSFEDIMNAMYPVNTVEINKFKSTFVTIIKKEDKNDEPDIEKSNTIKDDKANFYNSIILHEADKIHKANKQSEKIVPFNLNSVIESFAKQYGYNTDKSKEMVNFIVDKIRMEKKDNKKKEDNIDLKDYVKKDYVISILRRLGNGIFTGCDIINSSLSTLGYKNYDVTVIPGTDKNALDESQMHSFVIKMEEGVANEIKIKYGYSIKFIIQRFKQEACRLKYGIKLIDAEKRANGYNKAGERFYYITGDELMGIFFLDLIDKANYDIKDGNNKKHYIDFINHEGSEEEGLLDREKYTSILYTNLRFLFPYLNVNEVEKTHVDIAYRFFNDRLSLKMRMGELKQ